MTEIYRNLLVGTEDYKIAATDPIVLLDVTEELWEYF
jgi:hypothetical protein